MNGLYSWSLYGLKAGGTPRPPLPRVSKGISGRVRIWGR